MTDSASPSPNRGSLGSRRSSRGASPAIPPRSTSVQKDDQSKSRNNSPASNAAATRNGAASSSKTKSAAAVSAGVTDRSDLMRCAKILFAYWGIVRICLLPRRRRTFDRPLSTSEIFASDNSDAAESTGSGLKLLETTSSTSELPSGEQR